jgi:hypothetical protein
MDGQNIDVRDGHGQSSGESPQSRDGGHRNIKTFMRVPLALNFTLTLREVRTKGGGSTISDGHVLGSHNP